MLVAQITDLHIVEPGGLVADRVDTATMLSQAVATLNRLDPRPDLVLATGDLVNDGNEAQYHHLDNLLAPLQIQLLPVPGNHDDRTIMRALFADVLPPGKPDQPIDYVVEAPTYRVIGLDTTRPGHHDGALADDQLAWLDRTLSARPEVATIIFQHHPPFESGIAWMDRDCGFASAPGEADVIGRHPQVAMLTCGHYHRMMASRFAGTTACVWPSTGPQLVLDLSDGPVGYTAEPPALALHSIGPDLQVVSHLVPVGEHDRWQPSWSVGPPT